MSKKRLLILIPLCWVMVSHSSTSPQSHDQEAQAQLVAKVVSTIVHFAKNPKLLTKSQIERDFPGKYQTYQCNQDKTFCGQENESQQQPIRLNTYFIKKNISGAPLGGTLSVFIPASSYCLKEEELVAIIGKSGERLRAPLPMQQSISHDTSSKHLEYKDINIAHPDISIGTFVENGCVVHITLDALLAN